MSFATLLLLLQLIELIVLIADEHEHERKIESYDDIEKNITAI